MSETDKKPKTSKSATASRKEPPVQETDSEPIGGLEAVESEVILDRGIQAVATAKTGVQLSAGGIAAAASDSTRAVDAAVAADRISRLGQVVAEDGVVDINQGAEMLAASEDVSTLSAVIGMMSSQDLAHGLELARMAGELRMIGDEINILEMPVLADLAAGSSQIGEATAKSLQ